MSKKEQKKPVSNEKNTIPLTKKNLIMMIIAAVLALSVCIAAVVIVVQTVQRDNPSNGTVDAAAMAEQYRNTVAMTIGDHSLNAVELNYFYIETVNKFCQEYYYYIYSFGMIDTSKPLNQQYFDETTGTTWADYFLSMAKDNITSTYLLCDLAQKDGVTLTAADQEFLETMRESITAYATSYKFADADSYLVDVFGYGSDLESYLAYTERALLADTYYSYYAETLTYTDAQIRAFEAEKTHEYNSYSFAVYQLDVKKFLTGGSEGSDGNITYTDEQKAAAIVAAGEAANALNGISCENLDVFKDTILGMDVNASLDSVSVTEKNDQFYASIDAAFQEWIIDEARTIGDVTVIPKVKTTGEGENKKEEVEAYYILWFGGVNDNTFALKDVRHVLIMFKDANGKTYSDGIKTFTDEQKAAAKTEAERLLNAWKDSGATEDAFIEMARKNSADNGDAGGLYENIFPGQMVENFENWCYDESRVYGDSGLVESVYGYHIMFFVGDSDLNYRDYMITYNMRSADLNEWHSALMKSATLTEVCLDFCKLDMKLSG